MGWATIDEVLKHHRMLTKKSAFLRQITFSLSLSAILASIFFISTNLSAVIFFLSLTFIFIYIFDLLYSSKKHRRYFINDSFESQKPEPEQIIKPVSGDTHTKAEINKLNIKENRFFFDDPKDNKETNKLAQFIFSREVILFLQILISIISAFMIVRQLLQLSSVSLFLIRGDIYIFQMLFTTFGALYLFIISFISYIELKEIDEFSTDFWDKIMLRFYKSFAYSRNYFFIGVVNGKMIGLPRMLRFLHTMIGAPTGEGKSSSLIIPPLLFDADSIGSAVVPDAKSPELFNWVAGRWLTSGKKVFLFDPWHPDTIAINPLPEASDNDLLTIVEVIMREREEILKEDAFFKSRTKYLLFAILKLVQSFNDNYCNFASVYHIVQSVDTLKSFIETAPESIQKLFSDFDDLYSETKVNALTSIREKMDIFMEADVRRAFSKSEFKLDMLFKENSPCLLILGCPIDKKEPGTKIASLLVNLIVNLAFRERRMQKQRIQMGQEGYNPNDLYLYLDELRNLRITALADLISIARETRTHVIDSVTDIMFFKYYKEDFSSLMSNHRTRIFMRGLDFDSAKYVSDSLGKHDVATYRYFRGLMASQEQRNILDPDKVMNLPEDKMIVFSPKTRPFVADKVSIYKTRWLMKMRVAPPKRIREFYKNWGVAKENLVDITFPTIGRSKDLYDFEKIKGKNISERIKTNITLATFNIHKERIGAGKVEKNPENTSSSPNDIGNTNIRRTDEDIGMIDTVF